jgi:hypothetical protein
MRTLMDDELRLTIQPAPVLLSDDEMKSSLCFLCDSQEAGTSSHSTADLTFGSNPVRKYFAAMVCEKVREKVRQEAKAQISIHE